MNDHDTTELVVRHVERLAAAAADEVDIPPFEPPIRRAGHDRRWGVLTAAAVVGLLIAAGAGAWLRGDDEVRTVASTEPAPVAQVDRLVPTEWPSGLNGEITATDATDETGPTLGATDVLSYRGTAAATVSSFNFPLGRPDAPPYEEYELDGRAALWLERDPGGAGLSVAVAPGRTVSIAGRAVPRAQLEALASALAAADGDPAAAELPDGWSLAEDPGGVADLFSNGGVGAEWSTVSHGVINSNRALRVSTRPVEDADSVLSLAAELAGPDGAAVQLADDRAALLIELPPVDRNSSEAVIWSPGPGVVAVAVAIGIDRGQLLAAAESARSVSVQEWAALTESVDRGDMRTVDGFDIPAASTVVATGHDFGVTWLVTEDHFDRHGQAATGTSLWFRDAQGVHGGGGGGTSGGGIGRGSSRGPEYVTLDAGVPTGSRDVTFEVQGTQHPTVQVPMPDGRTDYVFTVLPARDTPDISGTAIVHATLPDGTRITSPPDPIPG